MTPDAAPRVSAIVVSYQVRDLLRACLASLTAQRGVELDVWVVDNASRDGSADMVAREFPSVRLIANADNRGFARANNQALQQSGGDFLALINPDTELSPDALLVATQVFARYPGAGVVGLALDNTDGSPQTACHAFPGAFNQMLESLAFHRLAARLGFGTPSGAPLPKGGEGPVDWVSGACMILSRAAYQAAGGLDEASFMYGEEMDWSWRARALGFSTVFCTRARVRHHGGASGAGARGELFVHVLRARLTFLDRYRGRWRARVAREVLVAGAALRLVAWSAIALVERGAGRRSAHAADQIERFRAVVRWRLGGGVW